MNRLGHDPLSPYAGRMRQGLRRALVILVMMVATLAAGWCSLAGGLAQPLSDGIAAIVNSEVITISELQTEMADQVVRLKARYEGTDLTERVVQQQYDVLNRMIERKLQLQEAKAKGIQVSEQEVERAREQLNQNATMLPGALSQSQTFLREELMVRRLMDFEIRRGIVISPDDMHTYYTNQREQFTSPPDYHLRQVLLLPKPDETMETLKIRADVLLSQLNEGADFAKLAEAFSDGPERLKGGDLGFLKKDELLAPLRAALETLTPGAVSQPIETELGVHILRLEGTTAGTLQPFDDVKPFIENLLYQQKTKQALDAWLASLKDKAYIEIRL